MERAQEQRALPGQEIQGCLPNSSDLQLGLVAAAVMEVMEPRPRQRCRCVWLLYDVELKWLRMFLVGDGQGPAA